MSQDQAVVDGFYFMPPSLSAWIGKDIPKEDYTGTIPWAPITKPLSELRFSLMTSAGINMKTDPPFDMEREKREPMWGDPGMREIPKTATEADIDVNHLHINTAYTKQDLNVMLPIARFREFEEEGIIGSLTPTCYSYYGFQLDPGELIASTMPGVIKRLKEEETEAVFLTPA